MYNANQSHDAIAGESASSLADSVEVLFPGVERNTLTQIIENQFKPMNIHRLLASKRDRAESQRNVSIGGVEFEQEEREGKECEYRMSNFFKACAAYSGILVKLAPYPLQGELATALSIYTMNLYDLLEQYTWEGIKGYHFQFHRKRVASGKSIYLANEWQQIDSKLIASKCFAYAIPRRIWGPRPSRTSSQPRRISELPIRERTMGTYQAVPYAVYNAGAERPVTHLTGQQATGGVAAARLPPQAIHKSAGTGTSANAEQHTAAICILV